MGRSMIGGGEGPSIAEDAASLPARLLGAMKELKSSENLNEGEREEKETCFSENSKRSDSLSFSPIGLL